MRLVLSVTFLIASLAFDSTAIAETAPQPELSGSWTFTWDGNDKNINTVTLKQKDGTISGAYINDSKENCPVAGRFSSDSSIILVIMCPSWDIKAEGSITSPALVAGKYLAYGDSTGDFKMAKN
jgi:hypothetical protein